MKVFLLMYYEYSDSGPVGIFSSFEKAVQKRDEEVAKHSYKGRNGKTCYNMPQDNFVISEEEVQ